MTFYKDYGQFKHSSDIIICAIFVTVTFCTIICYQCVTESVDLRYRFNKDYYVFIKQTDVKHVPFNNNIFNKIANYESIRLADIHGIRGSAASISNSSRSSSGRQEKLTSAHSNQVMTLHRDINHATWHTDMIRRVQQIKKDHPYVMANWNLVKTKTISTLSNFKNPCWYERKLLRSNCQLELFRPIPDAETSSNGILRCLPYFYIAGMPKCGTTDIYARLILHPQVAKTPKKEGLWFHRYRILAPNCSGLSTYLDFFHGAARRIESQYTWTNSPGGARHRYHDMITGDGTVGVMWHNTYWPELPGNENCSSVCVTNADLVHSINPHAKIVVALRNPVDRVYSHYMFSYQWLHYKPSPDAFHQEATRMIDKFQQCMKMFPLRKCVYNGTHENSRAPVKIRVGMYYVYLSDWLRVFPREQIHVIRFEDYIRDIKGEMTRLFKFLQLRPVNNVEMRNILNLSISNKRPNREDGMHKARMKPETRDILEQFYKPFNEKLAQLLNDIKYKFMK